ncbi:proline-specific peptidase [Obba rivulosa]|uniref:Proline-specific peptidase n=1 Tax=Obba rivulosa TaxID=1052685 RepID=A0A8E2DPY9_9APHY|nr:proline-specific peptidase [Obba rivulosa]
MEETTGTIPFVYDGETFSTWFKVTGKLTPGVRPLVVLHGGPGIPHQYMLPHAELATSPTSRAVIFYDQVGVGASSHAPDKPAEFWNPMLFIAELDNVLSHFGVAGDFDLVGHSWGGMLAAQYAIERRPAGLRHLILASTPASIELWCKGTQALMSALPADIREVIERCEQEGKTDTPEYHEAIMVFYNKHICRLSPWPEDLQVAFGEMMKDPTVYGKMMGPSEVHVSGTLKDWSIVDLLANISTPTLLINGYYDEAQDVGMLPYFLHVPKVRWVQFANSAHMTFHEEKEKYLEVVETFLTSV